MTNTICGHERDALIWALATIQNDPATAEKLRATPLPLFQPADMPTTIHKHRAQAIRAAHDPAKLAEMMAEELRARGVSVEMWHTRSGSWCKVYLDHGHEADYSWIHVADSRGKVTRTLDMPQARAALLRVMQLPADASTADVIAALEAT